MMYPDEVFPLTKEEEDQRVFIMSEVDACLTQMVPGMTIIFGSNPDSPQPELSRPISLKVVYLVAAQYRAIGWQASVQWGPSGPRMELCL